MIQGQGRRRIGCDMRKKRQGRNRLKLNGKREWMEEDGEGEFVIFIKTPLGCCRASATCKELAENMPGQAFTLASYPMPSIYWRLRLPASHLWCTSSKLTMDLLIRCFPVFCFYFYYQRKTTQIVSREKSTVRAYIETKIKLLQAELIIMYWRGDEQVVRRSGGVRNALLLPELSWFVFFFAVVCYFFFWFNISWWTGTD